MKVKINSLNKQIETKDLERFTRKLYIYRQKDRPKDEGGNGKGKEDFKMKFLGLLDKAVINKETSIPKPGDIVYAKNSDNCLIKDGTYGVIENIDHKTVRAGWNITTPYFDKGTCTVSGGPVIGLKIEKVRPTFNKRIITFWRFKDGLVMAHNGEDFAGQVNVFEYDFKS